MAHPSFSRSRLSQRPRLSSSLSLSLALSLSLSLSLLAGGTARAQQATQRPSSSAAAAAPTPSGHMIAEIQVIPRPAGTTDNRYKHVDAAIAVIQASGLRHEVHALGTVVEGPPEKVWTLLQAVHQATLEAGAERTLSIIKIASSRKAGGPSVDDLVRKFRQK